LEAVQTRASLERTTPSGQPADPRIGPHAIVQISRVIDEWFGRETAEVLLRSSTPFSLTQLPAAATDQRHARALVTAVYQSLGPRWTDTVLRDAGRRTGVALAQRAPRPHALATIVTRCGALIAGRGRIRWAPATPPAPAALLIDDGWPGCQRDVGALHRYFACAMEQLVRHHLSAPTATVRDAVSGGARCSVRRFEVAGLPD
jgi:bacteriochlorophyll 4-vinyl reductase